MGSLADDKQGALIKVLGNSPVPVSPGLTLADIKQQAIIKVLSTYAIFV